jgi:hypothetical protein
MKYKWLTVQHISCNHHPVSVVLVFLSDQHLCSTYVIDDLILGVSWISQLGQGNVCGIEGVSRLLNL